MIDLSIRLRTTIGMVLIGGTLALAACTPSPVTHTTTTTEQITTTPPPPPPLSPLSSTTTTTTEQMHIH
jgi:hypothetical protein